MSDGRDLEDELEEHRPALVQNGSVHWREERQNYVLRWREYEPDGDVTHHSLTLGEDPERADRARSVIEEWRAESPRALGKEQEKRLQTTRARIAGMKLSRAQRRDMNRRARNLIQAGRSQEVKDLLEEGRRTPRRRRGKPLASGLW